MLVVTYLCYIGISLGVTIWVAKTLHKNGSAFLIDAFQNNKEIAESINHLLVVGFYLINLGYMSYTLRIAKHPETIAQCIELLSTKIGLILLILGMMHFFNIYVFARIRKNGISELTGTTTKI